MVVGDATLFTWLGPLTHLTVLDRERIAHTVPRLHRRQEACLQTSVVTVELVEAKRMTAAVAEDQVQLLWRPSLNLIDQLRVGAELDNEVRLHGSGVLRVERLIGPVPELRGLVYPCQEVGIAHPWTVEEGSLVDHRGARTHRRGSRCHGCPEPLLAGVGLDADQLVPVLRPHQFQVAALMFETSLNR